MTNRDDDPFSALKKWIDQLQQHDENLVSNVFIYEGLLMVDGSVIERGNDR